MTLEKAYLPATFLDTLSAYLDERCLSAPALRNLLLSLGEQQRVGHRQFAELLQRIYELDPVPALGLRVGLMAKPEHFGLVGYMLASCSTLGQALIRYGRYQSLVLTDLKAEVAVYQGAARHQWMLHDTRNPLSFEFSAGVFITLYQNLINEPVAPASVGLPVAEPADARIYQALLGCPVRFNTPSIRVDIPKPLMLRRIATQDHYLLNIFDQQAQAILGQNQQPNTEPFDDFLETLQQQLLIAMKDGDTRAETVAVRMGYSLRSFYRLLNDNGHQYRGVLATVRRRLAVRYLADAALSPSDIALLLGYSEQSAFIRAFKSWMGVTPGEYRARTG